MDPVDKNKVRGGSKSSIFDTRKLAVIRSGKWKLMTGPIGFDYLFPDPKLNPGGCE